MEPPILFLIKEMSSFSTRSIILFDILSQLLTFISLQFFILFDVCFHCLTYLFLNFFFEEL